MSNPANRPGWDDIAEAAISLGTAAVVLRFVPFRTLAERLGRAPPHDSVSADDVERVRRSIDAWGRRLPFPPKCFVRGLSTVWMLRRRGRNARLFYGAATIDGKLKAHVWVRSGPIDVVGCDIADRYALLATFPEG